MTRNQLSTSVGKCSIGVMFTVDGDGNIKPDEKDVLDVNAGEKILTQAATTGPAFSGSVCVRETKAGPCKCADVAGISDGTHMKIGETYTISHESVPKDPENPEAADVSRKVFEIYAVDAAEKIPDTTNGKIRVGG